MQKPFKGVMEIKWHKNDHGDRRPLAIDCEDKKALNKELKRIKAIFMSIGDDKDYPLVKPENISKPAYSVTFQF